MEDEQAKGIEKRWDSAYKEADFKKLPWETVTPDKELSRIVKEGSVKLGKALDVGCGAGTNTIFMAKHGAKAIGLDISPNAVRIAEERARKENVECTFVVGNAYELPFSENEFDFVFDRGCFHHIPTDLRETYVSGIKRVLKSDGKYFLQAFSDSNGWGVDNEFSLDDLKMYFEDYFEMLESKEITHTQPDGTEVILWSILMKRISDFA